MWHELLHIPYLRYRIVCRVTGPLLYLPPLYELHESAFGREGKPNSRGRVFYSLVRDWLRRQFTCTSRNPCPGCQQGSPCDWMALFGNLPEEASHHFVIVPPLAPKKVYRAGETFAWEIKLLGRSAAHELFATRFMPALEMGGLLAGVGNWSELVDGHFGRFEIAQVSVDAGNAWQEIYNRKQWFHQHVAPLYLDRMLPAMLNHQAYSTITWITPFCLQKKHENLTQVTLADLLYFIWRRLCVLHQGNVDKILLHNILQQADKTEMLHHDLLPIASYREHDTLYRIGRIAYSHIPDALLPLCLAGSLIHIGKSTRYGYGTYCLPVESMKD